MSLQRLRYPLPKNLRLASALKLAYIITTSGVAIRGHLPTMPGGPAALTKSMLAIPLSIVLCALTGTLFGHLTNHSKHRPLDPQKPTNHTLADNLWLNCGYRICARE